MSTFLNNDIKYTVGKTALPCLDPTPEKKKKKKIVLHAVEKTVVVKHFKSVYHILI